MDRTASDSQIARRRVAIKKVENLFRDIVDAKRVLVGIAYFGSDQIEGNSNAATSGVSRQYCIAIRCHYHAICRLLTSALIVGARGFYRYLYCNSTL